MVDDTEDAFPLDSSESADTDGDGFGDNADADDDGDFIDDRIDAFPFDPTESFDTDEDGIGDNADLDDDNDNIEDTMDAFPLDPEESVDTDNDGTGDNADLDDDNDGCPDELDDDPLMMGGDCIDPSEVVCADRNVGNGQVVFGGQIATQIGFDLDSVQVAVVSIDTMLDTIFTDDSGLFIAGPLSTGVNYEIQPSIIDEPFPGVTTLDMLFVQRHILDLSLIHI